MSDRNNLADRVRDVQAERRRRRSPVPTVTEMTCIIEEAHEAAAQARAAREKWRRHTHVNNAERIEALQSAYESLLRAQHSIRRERSRAAKDHLHWARWGRKLADATKALQSERRRLWKMLPHPRAGQGE